MMMAGRGSDPNDWATIGRGMVDFTTPFSVYNTYPSNNEVFYGRSNLIAVTIADDATSIAPYAFNGCTGLTTITIPASVESIGYWCFQRCSNLLSVILERATPPTLGNYKAFDSTNDCPIYVPDSAVNDYKAAAQWSNLASRIFPISDMP